MINYNKVVNYYLSKNLKPIPVHRFSKAPIIMNWNNDNNDVIEVFREYPDSNIGILLGKIVDVEADTEEANHFLDNLLKDIPHPIYESSKSKHHLFLNPFSWLTRVSKDGIEFRGHKHQSIMPPSIHPNGTVYRWITELDEIPTLPNVLRLWLRKNAPSIKKTPKQQHKKIRCEKCDKTIKLPIKIIDQERWAFADLQQQWRCNACRGESKEFISRYRRRKDCRGWYLEHMHKSHAEFIKIVQFICEQYGNKRFKYKYKLPLTCKQRPFFVDFFFYAFKTCVYILCDDFVKTTAQIQRYSTIKNKGMNLLTFYEREIYNHEACVDKLISHFASINCKANIFYEHVRYHRWNP